MNEHPILFSTLMVQANLDGRKTNTRRMTGLDKVNEDPDSIEFVRFQEYRDGSCCAIFKHKLADEPGSVKSPYGQTGDILWVRETWRKSDFPEHDGIYEFKASMDDPDAEWNKGIWNPSIHMPKSASRIWLQVEEIRVERLNDISVYDAIAEGIEPYGKYSWKDYESKNGEVYYSNPKSSFKSLFLSINRTPKPQREFDYKGKIVSYIAVAWDQNDFINNWAKYHGEYRQKQLHVIINPWVWVVKYKILSTTGKPELLCK